MSDYVSPLKDSPNQELIDSIRNSQTDAYQARIPSATKAGVQDTLKALQTYRTHYNEFIDALVNRIGLVIARNMTAWQNPMAQFKRGQLTFGNTIEEIQIGLLEAHIYDNDREALEKDVWGTERPPVQSNFHTVNRQNYYKISINEAQLARAFLEQGGLSSFITQMLTAPITSDNWDEYLLMTRLFSEYESNGGFFKVNVPDIAALTSSESDAKNALRQMRALSRTLQFPSTLYNTAGMPTFATPDDLILFTTPEYQAAVDVEALAGAFNIDRANFDARTVTIPQEQFNIDGCQAILTTKDFFVCADQLFETRSIQNPVGLHSNYFLHHWEVVSASRFVPAIMFWTGNGDTITLVSTPATSVTNLTITDGDGNAVNAPYDVTRALLYQFDATVLPAGADQSVRWTLTGNTSPRTYITDSGVLHVGGDEQSTAINVTAMSTWLDPSNLMKFGPSASITVVPSGTVIPDEWPESDEPVTDITVRDVALTPVFATGTTTYTVTVTGGAVEPTDVQVTGPDAGNITVNCVQTDSTHTTVTVFAPTAPGQPTYTITVTHA